MTKTIGLVQLNSHHEGNYYLPYSVGILQAYAQQNISKPENFEFLPPIFRSDQIKDAVSKLAGADAVFFSIYVWNEQASLTIAKRLKAAKPQTMIVFGGPQVPDHVTEFMSKNQFVDIAAHGEGEQIFLALLNQLETRQWHLVQSISYRLSDGTIESTEKFPRIRDLEAIPSPYLSGIFDPIFSTFPDTDWIAVWETNRGCPFSCSFCDWGSAVAAKVNRFPLDRVLAEAEWLGRKEIDFVWLADANFGILRRDEDIASKLAETKNRYGFPRGVTVQSTKNAIDRSYNIHTILANAGLINGSNLAMQSADPETLRAIKRQNISASTFQELQRRFTADGSETYTDLILGLPGETYDSFTRGVESAINNGQHNRIVMPTCSILPNAEMGDPDYQRRYGLQTVKSEILPNHGTVSGDEERIPEYQQLIIATESMPRDDWVKARVYAWYAGSLYFNKLLHLPFTLISQFSKIGYRQLIECFMEVDADTYPCLSTIYSFLIEKAKEIQNGGFEFAHRKDYFDMWWYIEEFVLLDLCAKNLIDDFYSESQSLLLNLINSNELEDGLPITFVEEAIALNNSLLKLPGKSGEIQLTLTYNIWDIYQMSLLGKKQTLQKSTQLMLIDRGPAALTFEQWCRDVVWHGFKRGAYLYEPKMQPHLPQQQAAASQFTIATGSQLSG
jgi:radical SAM superfamily enzyme YgiQ (UPF0313 family)